MGLYSEDEFLRAYHKKKAETLQEKYAYLNQAMKDATSSNFKGSTWSDFGSDGMWGDIDEPFATVVVDGGFPLQIKIHSVKDYQKQN